MKKMICTLFLMVSSFTHANIEWQTNYKHAQINAEKEKKPLLLLFTDSEQCPSCKKLESSILSQKDFSSHLEETFAFVRLDFSKRDVLEKNVYLKKKFKVYSLPTIILISADGHPLPPLGYQPIAPDKFAKLLRKNIEKYQLFSSEVKALISKKDQDLTAFEIQQLYEKVQELRQQKWENALIKKGLAQEDNLFFLLERYHQFATDDTTTSKEGELLKQRILEKDPKNAYLSHYKLALIDFQERLQQSQSEEEAIDALNPLINYSKAYGRSDKANGWRVNLMIAQMLAKANHLQEALEHAQIAKEDAPDIMSKEIESTINTIKAQR